MRASPGDCGINGAMMRLSHTQPIHSRLHRELAGGHGKFGKMQTDGMTPAETQGPPSSLRLRFVDRIIDASANQCFQEGGASTLQKGVVIWIPHSVLIPLNK